MHGAANGVISFGGWVIFHCIYEPNLFIHSSINGRLGCFHDLAVVNCAAINFEVYISFWTTFFSRYMPKSGIAGSYDSSTFRFSRNPHTVLTEATSIYIPPKSIGGFPFLHSPESFILPFHSVRSRPLRIGIASNLETQRASKTWAKHHPLTI